MQCLNIFRFRYGPSTLATLEQTCATSYRTDRCGSLTLSDLDDLPTTLFRPPRFPLAAAAARFAGDVTAPAALFYDATAYRTELCGAAQFTEDALIKTMRPCTPWTSKGPTALSAPSLGVGVPEEEM